MIKEKIKLVEELKQGDLILHNNTSVMFISYDDPVSLGDNIDPYGTAYKLKFLRNGKIVEETVEVKGFTVLSDVEELEE